MKNHPPNVFVSSTMYDLSELRAQPLVAKRPRIRGTYSTLATHAQTLTSGVLRECRTQL